MTRFASVDDSDIDVLADSKDAEQTRRATEQSWRICIAYCLEKGISISIESITKSELNDVLKYFYVETRKSDGTLYRKKSLNCI